MAPDVRQFIALIIPAHDAQGLLGMGLEKNSHMTSSGTNICIVAQRWWVAQSTSRALSNSAQ